MVVRDSVAVEFGRNEMLRRCLAWVALIALAHGMVSALRAA